MTDMKRFPYARLLTKAQRSQVTRRKAAWIRDEGYPIGQPAPGHFNCECGTRVPQTSDANRCEKCGTVYNQNGWIQE